jgi:hypothetical protein
MNAKLGDCASTRNSHMTRFAAIVVCLLSAIVGPAHAQNIIDQRSSVQVPAPPELKRVTIVIVPIDGMSGDSLYPEQYTAWHLTHTGRVMQQVTLTKVDLIGY